MITKVLILILGLFGWLTSRVEAGLQLGLGPGLYSGTDYSDEVGYGLSGELGILWNDQPIDLFLGVKGTYVEGLDSGQANLDLFEGVLVGRVLFPLPTNFLKGYVEGSLGTANLSVSGESGYSTNVNGRNVSLNTRFDEADWVLVYGLGIGLQMDFTSWLGLRVGYEFHSFGEMEAFGLKMDPGNLNGFVGSLVLKF